MLLEGIIRPPSNISFSDGDDAKVRLGKSGEIMVSQTHAQYYGMTYWGMMFHGYSNTPATIPVKTTTSPTFVLWNPTSSGVNAVLVKYCMGYAANKNVDGNVLLGVVINIGSCIATGSPITAFTAGPVLNGKLGSGNSSHVRFGVAATITAATMWLPLSLSPMQLDAGSGSPAVLFHDFNGTVIVPPGVLIFTCASAASVATYNERFAWYEFPE
jgi:hypothetical protein